MSTTEVWRLPIHPGYSWAQSETQKYAYVKPSIRRPLITRGKRMIYKHKTQFYTFVLVRTANLPYDLGGRFDNLTQALKVRVGKFHFRSASSSNFVSPIRHRCLCSPFLGRTTTVWSQLMFTYILRNSFRLLTMIVKFDGCPKHALLLLRPNI